MTDNPRHSTASNEHYSPPSVVEAARRTLLGFDLDPASCRLANNTVGATEFFSMADNGYLKTWHGRVFLNPPGGSCDEHGRLVIKKSGLRPACTVSGECGLPPGHTHAGVQSSQKAWWHKLVREYVARHVEAAVFVCFSLELLQTTQVDPPSDWALPLLFPVCFPRTRVAYMSDKNGVLRPGAAPTHASMVVFLPPWNDTTGAIGRFEDEFVEMGLVIKGQTVSWLPAGSTA